MKSLELIHETVAEVLYSIIHSLKASTVSSSGYNNNNNNNKIFKVRRRCNRCLFHPGPPMRSYDNMEGNMKGYYRRMYYMVSAMQA